MRIGRLCSGLFVVALATTLGAARVQAGDVAVVVNPKAAARAIA